MTDAEESGILPAGEEEFQDGDEYPVPTEEDYVQFEAEEIQHLDVVEPNDAGTEEQSIKRLRKGEIRKPYSKWVLFCVQTRPIILQEAPGSTFKEIANALATRFKAISSEDNEILEAAVAADKERFAKEMEHALPNEDTIDSTELIFPLAKIKRAAKMDPDVKNIGKDSLILITKATELFVGQLALKCSSNVALRGARTISENDVVAVIHAMESLDFLRLDFPKQPANDKNKKSKSKAAAPEAAPSSGKGILDLMGGSKPRELENSVRAEVSQLTPL